MGSSENKTGENLKMVNNHTFYNLVTSIITCACTMDSFKYMGINSVKFVTYTFLGIFYANLWTLHFMFMSYMNINFYDYIVYKLNNKN